MTENGCASQPDVKLELEVYLLEQEVLQGDTTILMLLPVHQGLYH